MCVVAEIVLKFAVWMVEKKVVVHILFSVMFFGGFFYIM